MRYSMRRADALARVLGALATVAMAGSPVSTLAAAGTATVAATTTTTTTTTAANRALTGTWNRYPQIDETPDPKLPPPPPVGAPPLKPQYLAAWEAEQKAAKDADARGQPLFTDYVKCLPDGMPAMMVAMFPMEVLQTPGQVTIVQEAYNQVRRIYLNEKQIPLEDAEPGYWGHSVGHWQGNTLLVDTIGIKEKVRFRGVPHSDQMRIHERIRMLTPDFFEDRITVEDPVYLTQPWSFAWAYERLPHYKMLEYVCDSNREYKDPETGGTRLRIDNNNSRSPPPAPQK
jgi:hypothetical protein